MITQVAGLSLDAVGQGLLPQEKIAKLYCIHFPYINALTTIEALKLSKEAAIDIYRSILLLILRETNLYVTTL